MPNLPHSGVRYCHAKYCTFNNKITQYCQRFALFNIPSPILICWQELLYNKQNTCCLFHSHNMSSNEVYFKQMSQKKVKDFEKQRQDKWQKKTTKPHIFKVIMVQLSKRAHNFHHRRQRCPFAQVPVLATRLAVRLAPVPSDQWVFSGCSFRA